MELKVAKLWEDAKIPTRNHGTDAGIDFYALDSFLIFKNSIKIVSTGITIEIPNGYFMLIKPKGGSKWLIGAGVVDEGYQGEILVKVANLTNDDIFIKKGEAVAQGILLPAIYPTIEEVSKEKIHVEKTIRGSTGGIVTENTATFLSDIVIE